MWVRGSEGLRQARVHFWPARPSQVHRTSGVPSAVPAPAASRHRPAWTLRIDPSWPRVHFWLFWPLQGQVMTRVPLAVPWS
ncbi:hypothetical protein SCANM63S_09911 [Streptomyces canarius]